MKNLILTIISVLLLLSCNNKGQHGEQSIEHEILSLKTIEDKRAYLEKILEDDQKHRGREGSDILLKHGKDSQEYLDFVKKMLKQDSINLAKVERYLELYGHPDKESIGDLAVDVPWMVIHHAQGYDTRERNFETIYEAYLKGDIDGGAMSFYLGRMYQIKNRSRFKMPNPYREEDEINQLIQELGLEDKKMNVQKRIGGKPQ